LAILIQSKQIYKARDSKKIMRYIEKITDNIWKIKADSNAYFLDFEEKIIIDAGRRSNRAILEQFLKPIIDFDKITKVFFTHLHYDHIGNFDLFKNAKFYASLQSIKDFKENPINEILDKEMTQKFKVELEPFKDIFGLKVIETPGHTRGSVCIWYEKEKILFSGDTIFGKKMVGRTDLPTSAPDEMPKSLVKLIYYPFKTLCPGHDY
jgi:glyoxylase-like metal-dependent hydrolase (beta-lactamase superfamily II)